MKMKKFISCITLVVLALVSLFIFASCGTGDETDKNLPTGTTTLYVYNWGEYMADGSEGSLDVNEAFEEWYYENYGVKVSVNYSTYSSNEDLYAKISSGAVNYDVIIPSDYMIERMISEGLLAPLNKDNITNFSNIDESFVGDNCDYDPGNVYSVPYFYGMVGVIYNTEFVDEEDLGSWDLLWNEKYSGNILQFNNSRDAFGTAQYYLGYDVNTSTDEQWREALELLKKQKTIVQGYVMDEIYNKMENGSAAISTYYAGDFLTMYEENDSLDFYFPAEGTNLYFDSMCIPAASQNQEIAEAYINFMLTEEPAVENAMYTYYSSPNKLVMQSEDYIEYVSEIKDNAYELLYGYTNEIPTSSYRNLPQDKLILLNDLWEELKIEMNIGSEIYIVCAVVLVGIVGMAIFFAVRKKYRDSY